MISEGEVRRGWLTLESVSSCFDDSTAMTSDLGDVERLARWTEHEHEGALTQLSPRNFYLCSVYLSSHLRVHGYACKVDKPYQIW